MKEQDFEEFISQVDRSKGASACHIWRGRINEKGGGYGLFRGENAHRTAWRIKNGEIPDEAVVRHKCDNPPCCNPAHLEIGSHADNRQDCVTKGRHAKGQKHAQAKLTHRQVRFIRTHHKGWTHRQIAEKYGVSRSTITKILKGDTYQGVGGKGQ